MIQVLLFILKIIGITLLVIVGLLLLILAVVLFVPIFYRVRVIHNPEKTQVKARVSFLFPLLLVTVQYLKKISYKIRIFGVVLLDSDKTKKKKREKKKNPVIEPAVETLPETEVLQKPESVPKPEPESVQVEIAEPVSGPESEPETEKISFFEKIRRRIQKIRETISNITNKVKKLLHQKDEVQRILAKPETKKALKFVWDRLKRLLKHVFPRKMKGYVAYGADNPATTGQVLGVLSVVYARTGQLLEIRPNFTEKQLECDVELKGHIQVFTLLVIAIKVFMNQKLRQLITDFKNIKEVE